ncbi:fumarylacetoacetate hydrolase family protein [Alphaproteobacteria bacterium]|nr:fumarylacetoacetate hydrolase family protein [Alphaproteobacteria bacterium]
MRLVRYGNSGQEKPGLIDADDRLRDLSDYIADIDANSIDDASLDRLRALNPASLDRVAGSPRIGPCIANVGKFICIGLNFYDHARETGLPIPAHPIVFMKATSSINGPDDDIIMPRGSTQSDWEIELAVVIGTRAKYVAVESALDHVAGYCIVNDVSERHMQMNLTGQWTKGKSCDHFGPVGPWLVTRDAVPDPQKLAMRLAVNGKLMQDGSSADMIFSIAEIIAHLSELMTLHPGDIIATGTPAGVGMGQKPDPVYLQDGDVMTLEIDGLGRQKQTILADHG